MHKTLKLGNVEKETGPRANADKGGPLTEGDFHLGTGPIMRKNTEVCLLAKVGKPKRLSVGRRCAAPRPAQIFKNFGSGSKACFSPISKQVGRTQSGKRRALHFRGYGRMNRRRLSNGLNRKQVNELHRAWAHARGRMNRRRLSNGLNRKQVNELHRAWAHARRIGRPLNVMISIRPPADYDPTAFCLFAARVRNKLGVWAKQRGVPFVAAWARECNQDGTGEHLHILMHVPVKHYSDVEEKLIVWFPDPGAADVRPADQRVLVTDSGKRMSAIGYIGKQMTPQAWYRRGLIRKAGGPIFGKRGGITRNIGAKAIDAFFNARASCPRTTEAANDRFGIEHIIPSVHRVRQR
jgi:hypothetical protein